MKSIQFYSHVNYSVTKILMQATNGKALFYSHVNYSVTKIVARCPVFEASFTVT